MESEDDDQLTDDQTLNLPMAQGDLSRLWTVRSGIQQQRDLAELMNELNGTSSRHFLIFSDQDPVLRRRRQEEDNDLHNRLIAEQQLDYEQRSDYLLSQIEEKQRLTEKRRKEIQDNALKLRDGRRVYVDGNQYRDEQGTILTGADRAEADELHQANPNASTWNQKQEADAQYTEEQQLKDKILQDRAGTATLDQKQQNLSNYEKEFHDQIESHAAEQTDYGSADYTNAFDDDPHPSAVLAFTAAASPVSREAMQQPTEDESGSATANMKKPSASPGQAAPKPA